MGKPLPSLRELYDLEQGVFAFRFRTSQVTVIAGPGGSQKSGLATWCVAQWNLPTLFMSADTDQRTAITRLTAALTGDSTKTVGKALDNGQAAAYEDVLAACNTRFVYTPEPSFEDVEREIDAWVEAWDSYPTIIVLDNLLDIVPPYAGDNEYQGYKAILLETKKLARRTGACVIILHHMSDAEGTDARKVKPASRARLMGKVSQTPENILSVELTEDQRRLMIAAVKHRTGPSDKKAEQFITLSCDPERNQFARYVAHGMTVNEALAKFYEQEAGNG
jgi:hypothetical protein